jgi:hypothetical protein
VDFTLCIQEHASNIKAVGSVAGWTVSEVFGGERRDTALILTGVGVLKKEKPVPVEGYELETIHLEIPDHDAPISGTWAKVKNQKKQGGIKLEWAGELDEGCKKLLAVAQP